ncbi:MAG TPA: DUF2007 domain-containing protein [Sandaracinaceae bacterium LLY-WYZ-13_1]|nr:DUF2007 domain-containing protein [Sandaracinaceae bacterium LLY-WYZ-13_1]
MGDEEFVRLRELQDPVEASLVIDLLEQEGIPVSTSGLHHRGLLGMAGSFVPITLEVRERDRAQAEALLRALDEGEVVDEGFLGDEDEDGDVDLGRSRTRGREADPPSGRAVEPRRKRVAAGAAFLLPGGAHFYARAPQRGLVIVIGYVCAIAGAVLWDEAALWGVAVVALADVLGGFEAVERTNTGAPPTSGAAKLGRALAWGAPLWAIALPLGTWTLSRVAPATYVGETGRAVCEHRARCRGEDADACAASLAEAIRRGARTRDRVAACAACLEGRACRDVWRTLTCDDEPEGSLALDLGIGPLGRERTVCEPGAILAPTCATSCADVLPEEGHVTRVRPFP